MSDISKRLERVFNPKVIAVVGDKGPGYTWLRGYSKFTENGKLYSVQVDPREIPNIEAMGITNFSSLSEIPEDIDYVLCAVPRAIAPRVAVDAAKKKVGAIAFYTSGFAETDEEEGIRLQEQLLTIARENDLLIIGPNCLGLFIPSMGIRSFGDRVLDKPGPVSFISQSGNQTSYFGNIAAANYIDVAKAVSIGNSIVLDASHYLDYLTDDPDTKVIAAYMEGVKDGRALFAALKRAAATKPVVICKGGGTDAGQRATHSHTASIGTPARVWETVVKQTGIIPSLSLDETIDACKVLVYAKPTTGKRLALMAMSGGQSVLITDAFARAGFEVPRLTDESYSQLSGFFNVIGGSYRNPFDMAGTVGNRGALDNLTTVFKIVAADPNVDAIVVEARDLVRGTTSDLGDKLVDEIIGLQERSSKPVVAVVHPAAEEGIAADARQMLLSRGIAAFHSYERTAKALSGAIGYWRFRAGLD